MRIMTKKIPFNRNALISSALPFTSIPDQSSMLLTEFYYLHMSTYIIAAFQRLDKHNLEFIFVSIDKDNSSERFDSIRTTYIGI